MGVDQCQNYALLFFFSQNSFGWYTIFIWVLKFFGNVQNLYAWYKILIKLLKFFGNNCSFRRFIYISVQSSTHVVQNSDRSNSWVYQTLGNIVIDLSNIRETDEVSIDEADSYMWRVELVYRKFLVKEASGDITDTERDGCPSIHCTRTFINEASDGEL